MYLSPKVDSDRGVIVPLSAMMLVVMLSLVALGYYVLGYGASSEMSRNSAKFIVLAALETYMGTDCGVNDSVSVCHSKKMEAALDRANSLAERNSGGIATISMASSGNNNYESILVPLKWYDTKPTGSDPCSNSYPCGQEVSATELANAMRLEGNTVDHLSAMLSLGFLGIKGDNKISFRTTAVASPLHAMFIVDLSSSIVGDTHLEAEDAAIRNQNDAWQSEGRSGPYWGTSFSYLAKSTVYGSNKASDFQPDSGNSAAVESIWQNTPNQRPGNALDGPAVDHYKDDYRLVYSYAETTAGRNAYQHKANHPSVGQDTIVEVDYGPREPLASSTTAPTIPNTVTPNLIDKYRSNSYSGPEPFTSIAKATRTFLRQMKDRQIVGDKAGMVFANDKLTWNRVVNLSSDVDYLNNILDFGTSVPGAPPVDGQVDPTSVATQPPWVQIGLFPKPNTNTDLYGAIRMASNQLATDGDLSLVGVPNNKPKVPSVDLIVIFTDGLGNCSPDASGNAGMTTCLNSYLSAGNGAGGYKASRAWIEKLAFASFKLHIPIHVVLAGKQVGPHLRVWGRGSSDSDTKNGRNGAQGEIAEEEGDGNSNSSACLTEAEIRATYNPSWTETSGGLTSNRKASVDIVSCTPDSQCQQLWNNRYASPFTLAVKDWYDVAVKTGGVFAPILRADSDCENVDVESACSDPGQVRLSSDPLCRTPEEQVQTYLNQILRGSNAFTIVESN